MFRQKNILILITIICFTSLSVWARPVGANHYYVDPDGNDLNAGTSWATAFETIQHGVDVATDGDVVEVNEGTYYENISVCDSNIILTSTNPDDWDVVEATIIDPNYEYYAVDIYGGVNSSCIFEGFTVKEQGICCYSASPTIRKCIIGNDESNNRGIECRATSAPLISDCIIKGADIGIYTYGGYNAVIDRCLIIDNAIGVFCNEYNYTIPVALKNSIIARSRNEGVYNYTECSNGDIDVMNCTIYGSGTYGIRSPGGIVKNCIIWDCNDDLYDCNATYSCIEDGDAGTGNISSNPCFVDADANDFHLNPDSPCVNAGDPNGDYTGQTDIDGDQRKQNGRVDIGADESVFNPVSVLCVLDSADYMTALFDTAGNLFLTGVLSESTTPSATAEDEFRVQNSSSNDVAIIDGNDGNMYIYGDLYENQSTLDPNAAEDNLIVKDTDGSVAAYIDEIGNLYLRGMLYENTPNDLYFLPDSRFSMLDSMGKDTALFDALGNLLLAGSLITNTTPAATTAHELRVQDSNSNDIAIIDANNGGMYISGDVFVNQATLSPSAVYDNLIIKDNDGNTVSYIDKSGNLYLKGSLYEQRLK